MLLPTALCFEIMEDALRAPVRLECGPDVECIRQCFYRARRYRQARIDYHYDGLRFHVRGPALVIKKRSVPASNQRYHKLQVLRVMRDFVACRSLGVDGLGEQAESYVPEPAPSVINCHK